MGKNVQHIAAPPIDELNQLIKLFNAGRFGEVEKQTRLLLERYPNSGYLWKLLGSTLHRLDKDALPALNKAVKLLPNDPETHFNLGITQKSLGQLEAAVASYRIAVKLKPDFAGAYNNLADTLQELGQFEAAMIACRRALELKPNYPGAYFNLGNTQKDLGQLDDAIASYRRALEIQPDFTRVHGGLLFTLNYHPDLSAEEIYRLYQGFDSQHCLPLRPMWREHTNDRDPNRRLRIGYVSADFKHHSCRSFIEPLLAHHDKTQVEVFAYAEISKEDYMTARYKGYVDHWIPTKGMSDETLAERIRADRIDVLADLAGHTAGNRLLTFARKPAPVSFSWMGYGYTTGLTAIDYYLTDEVSTPPGSEGLFAEQPWRIDTPAYAYRPNSDMGEVNGLPVLQCGHITFGTLTRSVRINYRTIRVWSEILKRVEGSRLVINSSNFKEQMMRERIAEKFSEQGISRERLEIGYHSPPWDVMRGIDIGLDCFPHNSGTTLFESLYMGIPFITLADRPSVGRLGSCILHGIGHPEWIAGSEEEYIAKALELSNNLERLAALRMSLREEMSKSPLLDEPGFARKVEAAYRKMWKLWCENHK